MSIVRDFEQALAAAPELLEVVEAYLNWNEGDRGLTMIDERARAAIAKAKGERGNEQRPRTL